MIVWGCEWKGSFGCGKGMSMKGEDLREAGCLKKLTVGVFSRKLWAMVSKKRMWKPSLRICLKAQIVGGDKWAGVGGPTVIPKHLYTRDYIIYVYKETERPIENIITP